MINRRAVHRAAAGLGFALGAYFLWLAFDQVDANGVTDSLASINYFPILLSVIALSAGVVLRSMRWRVIAGYPVREQGAFFRATALGALSNMIFPGRAGELVRVLVMAKGSRCSVPVTLASAILDRLTDVLVLVGSTGLLLIVVPVSAALGRWITIMLVGAVVALLLVILYMRSDGVREAWIAGFLNSYIGRLPVEPTAFLAELRAEFRRTLDRWVTIQVAFVAGLVLFADYAALWSLLQAFDLTLPFIAPLLLWVCLAAGSALPSAPAYLGVYQVAAVWALSVFAVPAAIAVVVATLLQLVTLAVLSLATAPQLLRYLGLKSSAPSTGEL